MIITKFSFIIAKDRKLVFACVAHTVNDLKLEVILVQSHYSVIFVWFPLRWLLFCLPLKGHCYESVLYTSPAGEDVYHYEEVESKPTQSISHDYHTDSAYQENPLQYEVPVPQQHNIHKSNEVGKRETVWGLWDFILYIMNGVYIYHVGISNILQLGTLCSNRGMELYFWNYCL